MELNQRKITKIITEDELSVVAIVGDKMNQKVGIAGKAFSVLGEGGVNIRAIAQGSSEKNISVVIEDKDRRKALNLLHERFFSKTVKPYTYVWRNWQCRGRVNPSNRSQRNQISDKYQIQLKLIGAINSKKMLLTTEGMQWTDVKGQLEKEGIPQT